jgi:hypothetical protein
MGLDGYAGQGRVMHMYVFRIDIGTLGEQLVDHLELVVPRRIVEGGVATLR